MNQKAISNLLIWMLTSEEIEESDDGGEDILIRLLDEVGQMKKGTTMEVKKEEKFNTDVKKAPPRTRGRHNRTIADQS